ncbi:putative FBD-associated F-box protein At3g50710 [Trifolium pratense]|uniref:putative FBD-associated F-box protein At3g50710 n=1 Tax=Trifolium pratense TaxID=57577 RepID=UPI001E690E16|nr:putative FBD-associated F-box protein At3g50710 [Trifolium pratense]
MENSTSIDRISNIPDDILCHILSFLPTKDSFSTTLLSKRWSSLFKLLTALDFSDYSVSDNKESYLHFWQFVDTITLSTQLIKRILLTITCHRHHDCFKFDRWIETIKRHPVENLQISFSILLPSSIFRFSTLVVLKLLKVTISVDNISVNLPSLKTLHLFLVYFKNRDNFNNVLNGCPILEDFKTDIYNRSRGYTDNLKILSNLITTNIWTYILDVPICKAIQNVHFLILDINRFNHTDFPIFRNLIQLELSVTNLKRLDDVVELLRHCPKLQIFSFEKMEAPRDLFIKWKYPNFVPECISSYLKSCTVNYVGWHLDELRFAKYILQNARLLEIMKIDMRATLDPRLSRTYVLEELTSCPRISPQCKLSTIPC